MLTSACKKLLNTTDCINIFNKIKDDIQQKQMFLDSTLFKKMCNDIKQNAKTITSEDFYNNTPIKNELNWCELSDETIDQFFSTMCYVDDIDFDFDDTCVFDNYKFNRNGLHVYVMFGQGTLVTLTPMDN